MNYGTMKASLPLRNRHRKSHCFFWSLTPDNSGTTGITVETLGGQRRKKKPADGGGKEFK